MLCYLWFEGQTVDKNCNLVRARRIVGTQANLGDIEEMAKMLVTTFLDESGEKGFPLSLLFSCSIKLTWLLPPNRQSLLWEMNQTPDDLVYLEWENLGPAPQRKGGVRYGE